MCVCVVRVGMTILFNLSINNLLGRKVNWRIHCGLYESNTKNIISTNKPLEREVEKREEEKKGELSEETEQCLTIF